MRFQIPQFIETESKLIGPLTLKQFLWVISGGVLIYLSFMIFHLGIIFFIIAIPVATVAVCLAFLKIDDIPLINYISYAFAYTLNPKKYVFKNEDDKINLNK